VGGCQKMKWKRGCGIREEKKRDTKSYRQLIEGNRVPITSTMEWDCSYRESIKVVQNIGIATSFPASRLSLTGPLIFLHFSVKDHKTFEQINFVATILLPANTWVVWG